MLSRLFGRGRPPREVVVYTRRGCHLCEVAEALLTKEAKRHRLSVVVRDVDDDAAWVAEFGDCVPVVLIDGKVRFRGVVNEMLLARVLARPGE